MARNSGSRIQAGSVLTLETAGLPWLIRAQAIRPPSPGTPNTVYYGSDRLYRSSNRGQTMTVVSQAPLIAGSGGNPNVAISAIGVSPQNDNVRIVGLQNGKVFATTTGSS